MQMMPRLTPLPAALALGALLTLGAAPAAQAQDGKLGLYAGYAFLRTDDGNLNGIRLSPEFRLNGFASVVGDASWERGTVSSATTTITTYMGGLRLKRGIGSVSLFIHALAGGVRSSASVSPFDGVTISIADTGFGLDGGGGVEFKAGNSLKMRLGADYLRREIETAGVKANVNELRATAGFVF